jgi:serine/threonine protein kinase
VSDDLIDGRYRPTRVLGEGSFARTLACLDLASGQRPVALKELRVQGVGDWKPVELFEREALVLESLRHHGIPEIYRHFESKDASGRLCLYLAMELIEGPSLLEELSGGRRLGDVELSELALSLLDILEYLHARVPPVYHRDIKPSNIVRRTSGAPVLVDFGGVCHGWRPPQGGSTVTGTFGYMPPEQLLGQVSASSDLYALGATLLHLASGRAPTELSYDSGRLLLPPETAVNPAVRHLIDALLSPAPRERPPSALAARRLLLGALQHQPAAPPYPSAALAQRRENALVRMPRSGGGRPEMVDVGPPPRDPAGPLADVYTNLIEIFDGTRPPGPRKGGLHALGRWSLSALAFVGTLGMWTGYRAITYDRRRRVVDPIFRDGGTTTGRLVDVSGYPWMDMATTLTFEYEVQGHLYRDSMPTSIRLRPHFLVGDQVTVIYDQADPGQSLVAYRWRP